MDWWKLIQLEEFITPLSGKWPYIEERMEKSFIIVKEFTDVK